MGSTSDWGRRVIGAADTPNDPIHIDGVPFNDFMRGARPQQGSSSLSPMQILLEGKKGEKYTKALSDKLRYRKDMGEFLSLAGNESISQFGDSLRADVQGQQGQKEKQDQRAMTQGYYDQSDAHRKNVLKEAMRHNKAMEDAAYLKAMEDSRNSGFKSPSVSAVKKADDAINQYEGINRTVSAFKDEYATNALGAAFGTGSMVNFLGPKVGNQAMLDQARWWADYDLLYTLGTRNKLFGSALTDSEIKAWEGANISPNSTPEAIRRGLATLTEIADRKFQQQYRSDKNLYTPEWVEGIYAPYINEPSPSPYAQPGNPAPQGVEGSPPPVMPEGPVSWGDLQ